VAELGEAIAELVIELLLEYGSLAVVGWLFTLALIVVFVLTLAGVFDNNNIQL